MTKKFWLYKKPFYLYYVIHNTNIEIFLKTAECENLI